MIYYVTGTPGMGKSVFGAKRVCEALLKGKVVVTNMALVEGWERTVLKHAPYYRFASAENKRHYEKEIRSRYAYVPDIEVLIGARIYGKGESRGIRLIDEAHNEVNNREFMATEQKKILRKITLERKRGWDDYIIAQNKDNTDAALRRVSAIEIRCINWRKLLVLPFFHIQVLPFHFFLAIARHMNVDRAAKQGDRTGGDARAWSRVYFLGWEANVFNTFEDFDTPDEIEAPEETLWLPCPIDDPYYHPEFLAKRSAAREERRLAAEEAALAAGEVARLPLPSPGVPSGMDDVERASARRAAAARLHPPPARPRKPPLPRPSGASDESRTRTDQAPAPMSESEAPRHSEIRSPE
jgi:hypothetical protein